MIGEQSEPFASPFCSPRRPINILRYLLVENIQKVKYAITDYRSPAYLRASTKKKANSQMFKPQVLVIENRGLLYFGHVIGSKLSVIIRRLKKLAGGTG